VAALAGVSVATVSYVMNGRDDRRVGAQTRQRVLAAARTLGYVPDQAARSLRRRRTELVALVVGSIGVPAYDQIAHDLHAAADAAGYGVITIVVDSAHRASTTIELLRQRLVDGALIAPSVPYLSEDTLRGLARAGLPLVVMSNHVTPDDFDVVRAPERRACVDAMEHLLTSGRRRVAFVGHRNEVDQRSPRMSERRRAYVDALDRHGIPVRDRLVVAGADSRVAGYQAVAELLTRRPRPDAIFAASDRAAISAIWAIRDAGLRVPHDVAVVGVGNLEEGRVIQPTLSTVGPVSHEYSAVARLLFERLAALHDPDVQAEPPPARELVTPWSFIRRGST
jgi:LacI family transcriptional regulator